LDTTLRLEYIFKGSQAKDKYYDYPEEELYGFRLIFPDKTPEKNYYFIEKANIRDWKTRLSSLIIQNHFHYHYEALRKIGKGHSASVKTKEIL